MSTIDEKCERLTAKIEELEKQIQHLQRSIDAFNKLFSSRPPIEFLEPYTPSVIPNYAPPFPWNPPPVWCGDIKNQT